MNCINFKKNIIEFMEGNIDGHLAQEMEEHADACPSCRQECEEIKKMSESLNKDAKSINLTDKQKKLLKETILKAPTKKYRSYKNVLLNIMYAALIFLFISGGIYYAGGVNVNIGPSSRTASQQEELKQQVDKLTAENNSLKAENQYLAEQNESLQTSVAELEGQTGIEDWMMVNQYLDEALIEGAILSVDMENKKIKLNIYKDDNTPDIDPNIYIPDGIFITRPVSEKTAEGEEKYALKPGSIKDLKVGDHLTLHYIGKLKSARAILYTK